MAIFTMAKNESVFLPRWLNYYKQYFDINDMYVLDDSSNDNSTSNLIIPTHNIINVTSNTAQLLDLYNFTWCIRSQFEKLLQQYTYVFYADVDEYLVCTTTPNLRNYLLQQMQCNTTCFIATGYELYHCPEKGDSINFDNNLPILAQRQYVNLCPPFNKPVGANYFLHFAHGQHAAGNETPYSATSRNDPNLLLIHAKRFDMQHSLQRYLNIYSNYAALKQNVTPMQYIFENNTTKFMDELHGGRFNNTLVKLQSLLNYDCTHLF